MWLRVAKLDTWKRVYRELKNNLSRHTRCVEAGERVVVTAHGPIVAKLVPPAAHASTRISEFDRMISFGLITPPGEAGDPLENCPDIGLPPGTAVALIEDVAKSKLAQSPSSSRQGGSAAADDFAPAKRYIETSAALRARLSGTGPHVGHYPLGDY